MAASDVVWEIYAALLSMADCATALGRLGLCMSLLFAAASVDGGRGEAFNRLGVHFYERREWKRTIPLFAAAIAAERPFEGFITDAVYDWFPPDYLVVCLSNLGRFEETLERTVRALPGPPDGKRILDNLVLYAHSIEQQRRLTQA